MRPHWIANLDKNKDRIDQELGEVPPGRCDARNEFLCGGFLHNWASPVIWVVRLSIAHRLLSSFTVVGFQLRARHVRHAAFYYLRVTLQAQVLMRAASNDLPMPSVPTTITPLFFVVASVPTWTSAVRLLHGNCHRDVLLSFFSNGDGDGGDNDRAVQRAAEPDLRGMGDLVQGQREGSSAHSRLIATRVVEACTAPAASGV